uniref:Uncharacterized protein n=1 Tax=viral metagenome TaxID=1070528 RepID=A0A6M3L1M5_9ZZZZ
MADPVERYLIIISDSMPTLPDKWETFVLWLKPNDGWYKWSGSAWEITNNPVTQAEFDIALADKSDTTHSHPTHGDINFTGTVSADGDEGLTGTRTIDGHVLTFKKGLLTGYQAP